MTLRLAVCAFGALLLASCTTAPVGDQADITGTIRVVTDIPSSPVAERYLVIGLEEPDQEGDERVMVLITDSTDVRRDGEVVGVDALAVGQRVLAWRGPADPPAALDDWVNTVKIQPAQ